MRLQLYNMLQLLVVALLASVAVAKDAEPAKKVAESVPVEAQPSENAEKSVMKDSESAPPQYNHHLYDDHEYRDFQDPGNDHLYLRAKLDGPHGPREGPQVARNLKSSRHSPNIAEQDEIIKFVYSPAYYEPVWVLDYRFLKSGGRRYTRGPGGQVLILPKSYKHYKGDGTGDYDELIEYWRLKLIAEQNKRLREHKFGNVHDHGHQYEHGEDRRRGYGENIDGDNYQLNIGRESLRERESLLREREPLLREREPLLREREPLLRERESLLRQREPILREREHLHGYH